MSHLPTARTAPSATSVAPEPDRPHLTLVPSDPTAGTDGEDGSLVAEYGLLAVVAATLAGILMTWGRTALPTFFDALLETARGLVS